MSEKIDVKTVSNEALMVCSLRIMDEVLDLLNDPNSHEHEDEIETLLASLGILSEETQYRVDNRITINPPPDALLFLKFMRTMRELEDVKARLKQKVQDYMKHSANLPSPHRNN